MTGGSASSPSRIIWHQEAIFLDYDWAWHFRVSCPALRAIQQGAETGLHPQRLLLIHSCWLNVITLLLCLWPKLSIPWNCTTVEAGQTLLAVPGHRLHVKTFCPWGKVSRCSVSRCQTSKPLMTSNNLTWNSFFTLTLVFTAIRPYLLT